MESKRSIRKYIGEQRFFQIPQYQRGYKWGVHRSGQPCAAKVLLQDILDAFKAGKDEYFIQGVTVYGSGEGVVLIDGQQRTTTLFLLLSLLLDGRGEDFLFLKEKLKLKYDIRKKSEDFLCELLKKKVEDGRAYVEEHHQESQDIFNFGEAYVQMDDLLKEFDRKRVTDYVLDKVMLFYVEVNKEEATSVFSMLNGAKASMTTDELIKADFLCKASFNDNVLNNPIQSSSIEDTLGILTMQIYDGAALEWESNAIRSRLARSWDSWLYWWNRPEVKAFYKTEHEAPMELLLSSYCKDGKLAYSDDEDMKPMIFKQFQNKFIKDTASAKNNFEALRKRQKRFEDLYNSTSYYNYLGLALSIFGGKDDRNAIIRLCIDHFNDFDYIRRYVLLRIIGVNSQDIQRPAEDMTEEQIGSFNNQIDSAMSMISNKDVYNTDAKELAFRILFMLNVKAADDDKKKFKFFYLDERNKLAAIYSQRSLEHIWPKSKVAYKKDGEDGYFSVKIDANTNRESDADGRLPSEDAHPEIPPDCICRDDFSPNASEHCIGNLVFLHKYDNSKFNAKLPEDKKAVYFELSRPDARLYSRDLMHTISAFAGKSWAKEDAISRIEERKEEEISALKKIYDAFKLKLS